MVPDEGEYRRLVVFGGWHRISVGHWLPTLAARVELAPF